MTAWQLPHQSLQHAVIAAAASANSRAAFECLPELQHSIYTDKLDKMPEQSTLQLPAQPCAPPRAVKTAAARAVKTAAARPVKTAAARAVKTAAPGAAKTAAPGTVKTAAPGAVKSQLLEQSRLLPHSSTLSVAREVV